jgi:low temperature requirement protein LtrA
MDTGEIIPAAGSDQQRNRATHQTFQALGVRHATWLELFFDLVFVAVIGIVAHGLAHTEHGEIESKRLVSFFAVIVPTLWVWAGHTLFANRYDIDSNWQRACAIMMMGFVLLMSPYIEGVQGTGYRGVVLTYLAMQGVLALAYFTAPSTTPEGDALARGTGVAIVVGMAVSASSMLIDSEWRFALFYGGIVVQLLLMARLNDKASVFPVHRQHLIERIGLFAIIVLGETVIRIVGSFAAHKDYDTFDMIAAAAGFVLIVQIWWIFFGALHLLEQAKRIQSGLVVILSHLLLYVGMIFLANLTGHAINGDLSGQTFAVLGVSGAVLFYLGKQIPYFIAFPPYRVSNVVNTLICVGITVIATFLPRPEYSLIMMCFGMFVYVQLNLRWTIPLHNVDAYLSRFV